MPVFRHALSAVFVIWGLSVAALPAKSQALATHLAVYDLTLKDAEDRAKVTGASGRMVIELTGAACEGWTVNFRMLTRYFLKRGVERLSDNQSSSWESNDGNSLRFSQQHFVNLKRQSDVLLKADRKAAEPAVVGQMTKPTRRTFDIPADAIFPVSHQLRLIQAALKGESRDRSVVFDGSDGPKSHIAVSFIGKQETQPGQGGEGSEALKDLKSWPVSISYFSIDPKSGDLPVYQVSFRLFENGVAGDLTLDYGAFSLKGELIKLTMTEVADCG